MSKNPYTPDELPDVLPIFPLSRALLLPHGSLPLNIFEPRYLQMINNAMASNRMIGVIQPCDKTEGAVKKIGCAGKIIDFHETTDGRYGITLSGISRFEVREEITVTTLYRQVHADWSPYADDALSHDCLDIHRGELSAALKQYFDMEGMSCDWEAIEDSGDQKLITALCMICPFESTEKQALLESESCHSRAKLFLDMLTMHVKCKGVSAAGQAH